MTPRLLAIVGPTATGKSEAAIRVAERLSTEVVSVDSMTVYRGMDVGTAKPSPEERRRVRHHLFDVADPSEDSSVARYQELGRAALEEIGARERSALLVGGTGLYFRALVDDLAFPPTDPDVRRFLEREAELVGAETLHRRLAELDPAAAGKIERGNVRRTVRALEVAAVTGRSFSSFAADWERYPADPVRAAGIDMESLVLRERIETRVRAQLEGGLIEEARSLLESGPLSVTARQAIGYAEAIEHVSGRITLEEAASRIVRRSRHLARRQLAWFRRDPRIRWFHADERGAASVVDDVTEYLTDG
jgi:tRNA dimethylallyltransferase